MRKHHMWTKAELKRIISLWDSKSSEELAKEVGVNTHQISQIASHMRKAGIKISRKRRAGYLRDLLEEVRSEIAK